MDILQYVGSIGGIVGVYGYLIFLAYKNTVRQMREDRVYMEDRLSKIIESYNATATENTKVLTELITYLRQKNGNK